MRSSILALAALAASAASAPASAATVIIYSDPMTLERRMVVIDSKGPDRAFLCMLPPSEAGCVQMPVKRSRR
jgi:hypothetical protein